MTTVAPRAPDTSTHLSTDLAEEPETRAGQTMALRVWRPTSTSVVIGVAGELDAGTAPRLHELLAPRLSSTVETVILDLSELRFLGVAGLELLAHARRRAASRAMTVCIVDGPVCVDRALRAAGWNETVPTIASVEAAVAELTGRRRESPPRLAGWSTMPPPGGVLRWIALSSVGNRVIDR